MRGWTVWWPRTANCRHGRASAFSAGIWRPRCGGLKRGVREGDLGLRACADVVRQLLAADLIDRLDLSVVPVALGDGIRLFPRAGRAMPLRLESASAAGSLVRLVYSRA